MSNIWDKVDVETIRSVNEHWHWNVTQLMKGDMVKDVHWFDYPMYLRLIVGFKGGMVRIDEYSKQEGSNRAGTFHVIVLGPDEIKIIRSLVKRDVKRDTWEDLLKRLGAWESQL